MIKELGKSVFSILTKISPQLSAKVLYIYRTGEIPHIKHPRNFNDKMTKLKIEKYNMDSKIPNLADKYEVRKYVEERCGTEILNELYGVFDKPEDIKFDELPKKFAIKCNHGCAYNIICKDKEKLDKEEAIKKLNKWLKEKYGYATQELHYTKIKPRIIVEKYLCDENDKMPVDYKIYCFNGKAKCILLCSEREEKLRLSYYDLDWNRVKYEKDEWSSKVEYEKPINLDKMIMYAEKLSKDFDFVRVDLYNDNGKIIFGELTFTPACCCAPYYSKTGNEELGRLMKNI